MGLSTREIMNHPLDQYGQITVSDIKMKKKIPSRIIGHVTANQCLLQACL